MNENEHETELFNQLFFIDKDKDINESKSKHSKVSDEEYVE